ncbi:MAG: hypothetical protein OFPI_42120 [Osedax symbiont Rs2]|nr:MAG: hypothetical protein OFPI_42120 [Osedax symbiont Rs2]
MKVRNASLAASAVATTSVLITEVQCFTAVKQLSASYKLS